MGPTAKRAILAIGIALAGLVGAVACQSLTALECPGGATSCVDASSSDTGSDATIHTDAGGATDALASDVSATDAATDAGPEATPGEAGAEGSTSDAASEAEAEAGMPVDAGPDTSGIACMVDGGTLPGQPTAYCTPPGQECCYRSQTTSTVTCQQAGGSCPTDILCDKPSQCPGKQCWICLDDAGSLLGTACDLGDLGCASGEQLLSLCASGADCDAAQCTSQAVIDFPGGWFKTCQ